MARILDTFLNTMIKRYDFDGITPYHKVNDYNGLFCNEFDFKTKDGFNLKGFVYNYENYNKDSLVVFVHGIGGGHLSYLEEINYIAKNGYRVISYDLLGCFKSSGDNIRSIGEFIYDLDSLLDYIENDARYNKLKLILIGHSCGGFAVSNIMNFHKKNIYRIVDISGFYSIEAWFKFLYGNDIKELIDYEESIHKDITKLNSANTLKNSDVKTLIMHSKDDTTVRIEDGLEYIKSNVDNPNINYFVVDNKKHNITYSKESVDYLYETFACYSKLVATNSSMDEIKKYMDTRKLDKLTKQDDLAWKIILDFIK